MTGTCMLIIVIIIIIKFIVKSCQTQLNVYIEICEYHQNNVTRVRLIE